MWRSPLCPQSDHQRQLLFQERERDKQQTCRSSSFSECVKLISLRFLPFLAPLKRTNLTTLPLPLQIRAISQYVGSKILWRKFASCGPNTPRVCVIVVPSSRQFPPQKNSSFFPSSSSLSTIPEKKEILSLDKRDDITQSTRAWLTQKKKKWDLERQAKDFFGCCVVLSRRRRRRRFFFKFVVRRRHCCFSSNQRLVSPPAVSP